MLLFAVLVSASLVAVLGDAVAVLGDGDAVAVLAAGDAAGDGDALGVYLTICVTILGVLDKSAISSYLKRIE